MIFYAMFTLLVMIFAHGIDKVDSKRPLNNHLLTIQQQWFLKFETLPVPSAPWATGARISAVIEKMQTYRIYALHHQYQNTLRTYMYKTWLTSAQSLYIWQKVAVVDRNSSLSMCSSLSSASTNQRWKKSLHDIFKQHKIIGELFLLWSREYCKDFFMLEKLQYSSLVCSLWNRVSTSLPDQLSSHRTNDMWNLQELMVSTGLKCTIRHFLHRCL